LFLLSSKFFSFEDFHHTAPSIHAYSLPLHPMSHLLVIRNGSYEGIPLRGVYDLSRDATITLPTIGRLNMVLLLRAGGSIGPGSFEL
jgi:hypothetical protein